MNLDKDTSLALDTVRAASAQLVLIGHLTSFLGLQGRLMGGYLIQNFGVLLFFILSGFLIMYTIQKNENYTFKEYLIDRFSRIYVAFVPALVFVFIIDNTSLLLFNYDEFQNTKTLAHFFSNLLMFQDFPTFNIQEISFTSFGSGRPFWTVAIEWWMYLFFGFLYFNILKKNNLNWLNFWFFILLLIVPFTNFSGRGNGLTITWFLGVILFLLYESVLSKTSSQSKKVLLCTLVAVLLLLCLYVRIFRKIDLYGADISFMAFILIGVLIQYFRISNVSNWLANNVAKMIKTLAAYSYSLYLTHYTILVFLMNSKIYAKSPVLLSFVMFGLCNIVAYLFATQTEFKNGRFKSWLRNLRN